MTPAARVAAAIEVLDDILDGTVPEKALTGWGRAHRFAGSKDRAAIRDHVFQALRCRASYAWLGGAETGRGLMLGAMREAGQEDAVFTGEGHAPAPVGPDEGGRPLTEAPRDVQLDMPDWLLAHFDTALGGQTDAALGVMRARAGVFLRVNTGKTDREAAQASLASEGIVTIPVYEVNTALQVTENERRVAQSTAYLSGLVELQDTSSQRAIEALDLRPGLRVLDFCAGGGGKALAMAAQGADVTAFDIDPRRMVDIAARAQRAGVKVNVTSVEALTKLPPFDVVLCDAPCSGSGTWRRAPAAKWALTPERLDELILMQKNVLDQAVALVAEGGMLAYATCSIFEVENIEQVQGIMGRSSGITLEHSQGLLPRETGDGFFFALMRKAQ